jgi:hypothetical protein
MLMKGIGERTVYIGVAEQEETRGASHRMELCCSVIKLRHRRQRCGIRIMVRACGRGIL